jgi:3-deoxy-D-manno-octulosonic-acid transferase
MTVLYSAALALVLIIGLPYWLAVMLVSGKYREGLSERFGFVPARLKQSLAAPNISGTVWLHAVSVGEVLAAAPLILRLRESLARTHPQLRVVVSTTTRTGQQLARERFGAASVFYFPLDFRWILRRYLRTLRPRLLVLVETEFWPNYLAVAAEQRIPVAVVNARVSDRSYPRYLRLRRIWKKLLAGARIFLAQSPLDAKRLREIGAPPDRVHVSGNLKYDLPPAPASELPIISLLRSHLPIGAPVFVCGSTREGEEAVILRAHAAALAQLPQLVTILAPRHPERFDAVATLLPDPTLRRSRWINSPTPIAPASVFLLDSIGELARVYSVASIAFIGASLAPPGGGQNPLEPARFGIPILAGPYMQNFRDITATLEQAGALTHVMEDSLAPALTSALLQPESTRDRRASEVVEANSGATGQTLAALLALLEPRP